MELNEKLKVVFALVDDLKKDGIKSIVAGGCSRDIYHGIDPKDFDIIVPESTHAVDVAALLTLAGHSYRFFPMYDKADSDRIEWVFKATIHGVDVDIIRYAIVDVEDAPEFFDFNINQYVTSEPLGNGMYVTVPFWKCDPKHGLVAIRGDHSEKRFEYIKAKWESIYGTPV